MTRAESVARYDAVNDGRVYPAITNTEARRAMSLLLREFGKPGDAAPRDDGAGGAMQPLPLWKSSTPRSWTNGHGYRRVWVSPKPTRGVNKGWGRLIHDVSHMVHRYRNPKARPHEGDHHRVESEVMSFVIAAGWLDGKLKPVQKPKLTTAERRTERHAKLTARLARWETKAKRAENAMRKLRRQIRALTRSSRSENE